MWDNKTTKPQPKDYTNCGKTNEINNIGQPMLIPHYKKFFNANGIKRSSTNFENPGLNEIKDLDHAVDVELKTIYNNTIYIQEKIRTWDKLRYNDFTIGLYKHFESCPINATDNLGEFFHLHAQYYTVAYLNQWKDAIAKIYILNVPKLIQYIQKNHLLILDNAYIDTKLRTISQNVDINNRRQIITNWECEDEIYNNIVVGKDMNCNRKYSSTLFITNIKWEDLGDVVEYGI
jgi:hypothetical protein